PGRRLFPRYQVLEEIFQRSPGHQCSKKRTTETADGPKSAEIFSHSRCQLAADRLAAAAGLTLALHWPFGPLPLYPLPLRGRSRRTPVTLGIGRYRHSSLLAREGARDHSINQAIQRSTKEPVPNRQIGAQREPDCQPPDNWLGYLWSRRYPRR